MRLVTDRGILLLGIDLEDGCARTAVVAAFFVRGQGCEPTQCPPVDKTLNDFLYTHTIGYYVAVKRIK